MLTYSSNYSMDCVGGTEEASCHFLNMFATDQFPDDDFGLWNAGRTYLEMYKRNHSLSQVNSTDFKVYPSQYSTLEIATLSVIATAMMIIVIVGNMLVIIAIATEHSLTGVQNWFIASLAFADLMLGLIIMPFSLAQSLLGYWMFGALWCDIHAALDVMLCTASIMNICLISLDRYWCITRALDYLNNRTQPRVLLMIVIVWILSAFISIPPLLGWKQDPEMSWFYNIMEEKAMLNLTSAQFLQFLTREMSVDEISNFTDTLEGVVFPKCQVSEEVGYVVYSAFGSFYIPSCIMVFVYIKIYYAARARARRHIKPKATLIEKDNRKGSVCCSKVYTDNHIIKGKPKQVLVGNTDEDKQLYSEKVTCSNQSTKYGTRNGGDRSESDRLKVTGLTDQQTNGHCANGKRSSGHKYRHQGEPIDNMDASSSDSSNERCGPIRTGNIFHKLRVGRRLSKDVREMIDIGKIKTVSRPEPTNSQDKIDREKRKLARQKERRATFILGLIMGSFIACWLPFFILYLIGPMCPVCHPGLVTSCCVEEWIFSFAFWLGYSNSALNPVIYTVFNKDFRKAFKKILFK